MDENVQAYGMVIVVVFIIRISGFLSIFILTVFFFLSIFILRVSIVRPDGSFLTSLLPSTVIRVATQLKILEYLVYV